MNRVKSIILSVLGLLITIAVVGYFVFPDHLAKFTNRSTLNGQLAQTVEETKELLPGPLRSSLEAIQSKPLTRAGVLAFTNSNRATEKLQPLTLNAKLSAAAEDKVSDMFLKQYFEHVSPTGRTPSEVIKAAGYQYIVIGENLALGNFKDDQALVQAWMDSPGHRENIMNPKFREIGIAVRQGTYEGKKVWLAVQHFGTPLSLCPSASVALKNTIETNKSTLSQLEQQINELGTRLEPEMFEKRKDYVQAVEKYNALVQRYNDLASATRSAVESYNKQIEEFNRCLETNG